MKHLHTFEEFVGNIVNEARAIAIPDNMRIHMSKTPIVLQKKKYSQVDGMKPDGFWYGFGKNWIDWTKSEMPEWTGKYIYEVKIPNNILKITSYKELLQFNEEFKINIDMMDVIDWKKVASKYNGIEIAPYQYKARLDLLWYYGWDIGSGCVWNLDNTSLLKVNEGFINEADPAEGTGKKPKGSDRRLYTDEDPDDTVPVKFRTAEDIEETLDQAIFKSKPHVRQSQIINLIHQRTRVAHENAKDPKVIKRLGRALEYIEKVKEESKLKTIELNKERDKK